MKLGRLLKNNSYEDPCLPPPWLIGEKRRGELWAKDMHAIIK
jgi:hypothetical protein